MNEDELRFRDLSFKDKVLSVLMTIALILVYTISILVVLFIILPLRINMWNNIIIV